MAKTPPDNRVVALDALRKYEHGEAVERQFATIAAVYAEDWESFDAAWRTWLPGHNEESEFMYTLRSRLGRVS